MIKDNTLVSLEYHAYEMSDEGRMELMEESTPEEPLRFIVGVDDMLPAFVDQIRSLGMGDAFEFKVACEDAFGPYLQENVQKLPRDYFAVDGKIDENQVYNGAIVRLVNQQGQPIHAEVVSVEADGVTVDLNHPLAGKDVYYKGKLLDALELTPEQLKQLTRSGCSCGCSGGCNDTGCGCDESGCGGCH